MIQGLSRSGNKYAEAVECLRKHYERPKLICEIHVKAIVQHLRALTVMGYKPSASFITSLIELMLDQNTRFEWQTYTRKVKNVPNYDHMLIFLDMRAQASETLVR